MTRKKILLVDGTLDFRKKVENLVQHQRYDLLFAGDGIEGLKKYRHERIDLILTHLNMPRMDGLELMFNVQELNPEIPVIVFYNENRISNEKNILKAGAFACLRISSDEREISRVIKSALEKIESSKNSLLTIILKKIGFGKSPTPKRQHLT